MTDPNVTISSNKAGKIVDPRTIKRRAQRLLSILGHESAELSVVLCDDSFIRELNKQYRNKDKSTDVLSFAMNEGEDANPVPDLLGDVIVSTETAARQASDAHKTSLDEVTSLLIHGLLHLIGFDHQDKKSQKAMFDEAHRLEQLIVSRKKHI